METNENENTMVQNLWDSVKAILREKFMAILAYLKKQEKSPVDNLTWVPGWLSWLSNCLRLRS